MSEDGMPLREQLVVKSLGYLKFPKQFVERFDIEKTEMPSPRARIDEQDENIRLVFEWTEEEIAEAQNVEEE